MRTSFTPAIGVLSIAFCVSPLGCSGSSKSPELAPAASNGGQGDSGGSSGVAAAAGGESPTSGGGSSASAPSNGGSAGAAHGVAGAPAGGAPGAGGSGGGCDQSLATWTDGDDLWASKDYGPNFLRKNFWNNKASGAGPLTLWAASSSCWGVVAMSDDTVNPGTVKSYPDMARGWVVGTAGFQNPNSGLPIQVKDLRKAKIRWNMAISGSPLRHYALWDIYFHESAMPGKGAAPVNLMIKQRVVDPSNYEQDKESGGATAVTQNFSGITFRENKNTGLKSGTRIVVELFATPVNGADMGVDDMTLDLKEVIDHYVADGSILTTDYLTSIQAGWEIVAGGTFVTKDFWTALQDEPEPTH
ncbi:MAG TPA: hypothetical protein VER96_37725 [Polyangiaceae bacterium]|nr:hypothetical protein [Polyangiaceae bacterium]